MKKCQKKLGRPLPAPLIWKKSKRTAVFPHETLPKLDMLFRVAKVNKQRQLNSLLLNQFNLSFLKLPLDTKHKVLTRPKDFLANTMLILTSEIFFDFRNIFLKQGFFVNFYQGGMEKVKNVFLSASGVSQFMFKPQFRYSPLHCL